MTARTRAGRADFLGRGAPTRTSVSSSVTQGKMPADPPISSCP